MLNSSSEAVVVTEQGSATKTRSMSVDLSRKDGTPIEHPEYEQFTWAPDGSDDAFR